MPGCQHVSVHVPWAREALSVSASVSLSLLRLSLALGICVCLSLSSKSRPYHRLSFLSSRVSVSPLSVCMRMFSTHTRTRTRTRARAHKHTHTHTHIFSADAGRDTWAYGLGHLGTAKSSFHMFHAFQRGSFWHVLCLFFWHIVGLISFFLLLGFRV